MDPAPIVEAVELVAGLVTVLIFAVTIKGWGL